MSSISVEASSGITTTIPLLSASSVQTNAPTLPTPVPSRWSSPLVEGPIQRSHQHHDTQNDVDTSNATGNKQLFASSSSLTLQRDKSQHDGILPLLGQNNTPINAKLFSDVECGNNGSQGCDLVLIGRTRLNFNSLLTPPPTQPHERSDVSDNTITEKKQPFGKLQSLATKQLNELQNESCDRHEEDDGEAETQIQDIFLPTKQTDADTSHDLTQPYDQNRTESFPSVSSNSQITFRNVSASVDDTATTTTHTPFRLGFTASMNALRPKEVEFPQLDASQCSPIQGPLDDDEDLEDDMEIAKHTSVSTALPSSENSEITMDEAAEVNIFGRNDKPIPPLPSQSMPEKEFGANSSNSSSCSAAGSGSSKGRKLRPMPDMSAFDVGNSSGLALSQRRQSVNAQGQGYACAGGPTPMPRSPFKLLCPPTPVRTPTWAHSEMHHTSSQSISDSLITSKVLAACPPQILDGLSSLENSFMEDDKSGESKQRQKLFNQNDDPAVCSTRDGEENYSSNVEFRPLSSHADQVLSKLVIPQELKRSGNNFKFNGGCWGGSDDSIQSKIVSGKERVSSSSNVAKNAGSSEVGSVISFDRDFENFGQLGRGSFADVYKVRSRQDKCFYAIKRKRRQFRGKRDRERAMAEVHIMQRLQCFDSQSPQSSDISGERKRNNRFLFLLVFIRAWQEDGYFFCQTELCCRDTCRDLITSLTLQWERSKAIYPQLLRNLSKSSGLNDAELDVQSCRQLPESTVWKICHDVLVGLSHIHAQGVVHHDIKPPNIFFVAHSRFGTLCKIGDFGMAGNIGTMDDGQEGDTAYMPQEVLTSSVKHPSGDIFSLGLTLYELAAAGAWEPPSEGSKWHEIRSASHNPEIPKERSKDLLRAIRTMIHPDREKRLTADRMLEEFDKIKEAGSIKDTFLADYVADVEEFDSKCERELSLARQESCRATPTAQVL